MTDSFGRTLDYLRLSLTAKCNFSCLYCNPKGSCQKNEFSENLSFEEYKRLIKIFSELGIKKIRLTGGEPLLFRELIPIIQEIRNSGIENIALTTNGFLFSEMAEKLKEAGLTAVNFSLDALDEDVFEKVAGVKCAEKVWKNILLAKRLGFKTKINSVIIKDLNENQIEKLAEFALKNEIELRFIELMPLGFGKTLDGVKTFQIQEKLKEHFGGKIIFDDENAYAVPGKNAFSENAFSEKAVSEKKSFIKFITPVSHKFCSECNRLRITSDGKLKLCLAFSEGVNLKKLMQENDDFVKNEILRIAKLKPKEHNFNGEYSDSKKEEKLMQQIGG